MPRKARLVVPGLPHHVTQRGVRKQTTFFSDADYRAYLAILGSQLARTDVGIWAYCLMPNHVHFVAVPAHAEGLAQLFRVTHRTYAHLINARNEWQGHLWQERFRSFVMDEAHALAAMRYVELNPVRAGLCCRPQDWLWSSARAHLAGRHDPVLTQVPLLDSRSDWSLLHDEATSGPSIDTLRRHSMSGLPAGEDSFLARLESGHGACLRPAKRGPRFRT